MVVFGSALRLCLLAFVLAWGCVWCTANHSNLLFLPLQVRLAVPGVVSPFAALLV